MTLSFRDRVAEYFTARPLVWVNAIDLERVGGRQAWRTRISDCRVQLGMTIENRKRKGVNRAGEPITISEYRYVPYTALSRPAHAFVSQVGLFS